nr:immunoglobulin heavy chain junction region [Macaca mulatta]
CARGAGPIMAGFYYYGLNSW